MKSLAIEFTDNEITPWGYCFLISNDGFGINFKGAYEIASLSSGERIKNSCLLFSTQ